MDRGGSNVLPGIALSASVDGPFLPKVRVHRLDVAQAVLNANYHWLRMGFVDRDLLLKAYLSHHPKSKLHALVLRGLDRRTEAPTRVAADAVPG